MNDAIDQNQNNWGQHRYPPVYFSFRFCRIKQPDILFRAEKQCSHCHKDNPRSSKSKISVTIGLFGETVITQGINIPFLANVIANHIAIRNNDHFICNAGVFKCDVFIVQDFCRHPVSEYRFKFAFQ